MQKKKINNNNKSKCGRRTSVKISNSKKNSNKLYCYCEYRCGFIGRYAPLDEGKVFIPFENVVEPRVDLKERLHFQELKNKIGRLEATPRELA